MASASDPQDWDRAGVAALGSHCELRLGVCFWFRLFYVDPETTARFIRLEHRSRSQSPPCQCASTHCIGQVRQPISATDLGNRSRQPISATDLGETATVTAGVGTLAVEQFELMLIRTSP